MYQPQFNVQKQQLLTAEALIRWNHPQKGLVLPLDLIPAAEATGLIILLGEWVINEVCKQHQAWRAAGLPPIRIAINVSMYQLRQLNFASNLQQILLVHDVAAQYIEIEIAETILLAHHGVLPMINELKRVGVRVVIDDFGSAHSSMNYLKELHIDGLKIDPSFVKNIAKIEHDEWVIKAIIAIAKSLNFNVFAEGVETQNQLNFLQNHQCDGLQGYHFSRPIPAESVTTVFKHAYTINEEWSRH